MGKSKKVFRIFRLIPIALLVAFAVAVVSILGFLIKLGESPMTIIYSLRWWIGLTVFISLALIILQTYLQYLHETYNPTLALKYEEKWDSEEMEENRHYAAKAIFDHFAHLSDISKYRENLEPIDLILDFIDTIGFLFKGGQLSEEVIHHYFYYWIRGYWHVTKPYVRAWQSTIGERRRWENISSLYDSIRDYAISTKRETREEHDELTDELKIKFIEEEMRMWNEKYEPK
jgi:hypothetical protein